MKNQIVHSKEISNRIKLQMDKQHVVQLDRTAGIHTIHTHNYLHGNRMTKSSYTGNGNSDPQLTRPNYRK